MKKFVLFWGMFLFFAGCTVGVNDEDTESDSGGLDTGESDSVDSDTGEETSLDTADGVGGADEACYYGESGDAVFMWCDTPELVVMECDGFANNCCCRSPCEPTMCDNDEETIPCNSIDPAAGFGYCDYQADAAPVAYECSDTCTPRSHCITTDTDGSCLDIDAPLTGQCLISGQDTDAQLFCQPTCTLTQCDSTHYCSPLFTNNLYDGTAACLPHDL